MLTYADDNYAGASNELLQVAVNELKSKMERIIRWMKMSGLKINVSKTEICVFHRRNIVQINVELDGTMISSMKTMNVLGITFDSNLKWKDHVEKAIKESNSSLYALQN